MRATMRVHLNLGRQIEALAEGIDIEKHIGEINPRAANGTKLSHIPMRGVEL